MPRSKTRARLRAARAPIVDSKDPMEDDSGRTAARMNYLRRDISRRLRLAAAARKARQGAPPEQAEEV